MKEETAFAELRGFQYSLDVLGVLYTKLLGGYMMKRCRFVLLATFLSLTLIACGGTSTPASSENGAPGSGTPASTAKVNLIIGTGGVGGSYYPMGGSLAKVWTNHIDGVSVSAQSTGASVENTALLENSEIELGLTQNDLSEYAVKGEYMFDKQYQKLRAMARLCPEEVHIFVRNDANINSIEDLRGKKISVNNPGSGSNANAEQILGVFGLGKDDYKGEFASDTDTADRIKDGLLDGMITTTAAPAATFQEMCMSADVKLLDLSDEEIDQIIAAYPFFSKSIVPANTYQGQTEDVQTVTVQSIVACRDDLDEELVYQLTKALWEGEQELKASLANFKNLDVQKAMEGVTIDFHPGAMKYYKEIGLVK